MLYAASGAVALYAGAAVALAVGLALGIGLPDWAAALITAAILAVVAYLLRGAARPHASSSSSPTAGLEAAPDKGSGRVIGGTAPAGPPGGTGLPYPPMPPTAPGAQVPEQGGAPRADDIDPESPHRA